MTKEFIVAIELGSSKIVGIAGKKNKDGSINVLALVQENPGDCIKKGIIYNVDKTAQCLTSIVGKLRNKLKTEISKVYVGVGGRSIHSELNVEPLDLPDGSIVSHEMVYGLMDANRSTDYNDYEILDVATHEYKVDSQYQIDPVGIQCRLLEGNFLNILWNKKYYESLNTCFKKAGLSIAEFYLSPLAVADSILTETEKRAGSVLVDLGAETTTVSVYYRNILRHIAVIPLGMNNITKDLTFFQIEDEEAESIKLTYASAYTEDKDIDDKGFISLDHGRQIEQRRFVEMVEHRVEEIIGNAWYQVPTDYSDKLLGGIVLTGGGSNLRNMETAFRRYTHVDKVRTARFVNQSIHTNIPELNAHNGMMNTILAILAKGDINCAGSELRQEGNLFADPAATQGQTGENPPTKPQGTGKVLTEEEKQRQFEEKQRQLEEEQKRQREEDEKRQREEEEKRRNKPVNKFFRKMGNFFKGMMEPEEEE